MNKKYAVLDYSWTYKRFDCCSLMLFASRGAVAVAVAAVTVAAADALAAVSLSAKTVSSAITMKKKKKRRGTVSGEQRQLECYGYDGVEVRWFAWSQHVVHSLALNVTLAIGFVEAKRPTKRWKTQLMYVVHRTCVRSLLMNCVVLFQRTKWIVSLVDTHACIAYVVHMIRNVKKEQENHNNLILALAAGSTTLCASWMRLQLLFNR